MAAQDPYPLTTWLLLLLLLFIYLAFQTYNRRYNRMARGAIAQSVEQWSRNPVTRVRNQVDTLVPFGKALILITRSLGEDLKPLAVWLLTYAHLCFLSSQVNKTKKKKLPLEVAWRSHICHQIHQACILLSRIIIIYIYIYIYFRIIV